MVRNKNKGFSLIEVIVAVAILTILMAPIVEQIIQTLNTSAQAKERQYAVENAEYVLNTFQQAEVSELSKLNTGELTKLGDIENISADYNASQACSVYVAGYYDSISAYTTKVQAFNSNHTTVVASKLASVDSSGNTPIGATLISTAVAAPDDADKDVDISGKKKNIKYASSIYKLDSEKMGRKNTYQKTVYVDNLSSMLLRSGLAIETHFTDGQIDYLKKEGYTITTEGSAVKYDAKGVVTAIICAQIKGIQDPNGIGVSYLADLNSNQVAIIQGASSALDTQAASEFYTRNMERLKNTSIGQFENEIIQGGESIFEGADYIGNVSKMTKITINSGYESKITAEGEEKQKYYLVDCTVYYENYMKNEATEPDVLTYNIFRQKFYTVDETGKPVPPMIYLVYEPYVVKDNLYVDRDYILTYDGIDYDLETSHPKLYIVTPRVASVMGGMKSEGNLKRFETSYNQSGGLADDVMISLNYLKKDENSIPIQVFTNILHEENAAHTADIGRNFKRINVPSATGTNGVVYPDNTEYYYGVWSSSSDGEIDTSTTTELTRAGYPIEFRYNGTDDENTINDIGEDRLYSNKLFSISVQLDRTDDLADKGYSVRLTGAKGVE